MLVNDGWIKLHRKLLENEELRRDHNALVLFVYLLLLVNKNTGTYTAGRFQLAELTGLKPITAYRSLLRLKKMQIVNTKVNNKFTIISICKWSDFQSMENTLVNNKRTTSEQQVNTKQEVRIKKERVYVENNLIEFEKLFPKIDVKVEWDKCQDYYDSRGKVMKDWSATFRNWLRSDIPKKENITGFSTW